MQQIPLFKHVTRYNNIDVILYQYITIFRSWFHGVVFIFTNFYQIAIRTIVHRIQDQQFSNINSHTHFQRTEKSNKTYRNKVIFIDAEWWKKFLKRKERHFCIRRKININLVAQVEKLFKVLFEVAFFPQVFNLFLEIIFVLKM